MSKQRTNPELVRFGLHSNEDDYNHSLSACRPPPTGVDAEARRAHAPAGNLCSAIVVNRCLTASACTHQFWSTRSDTAPGRSRSESSVNRHRHARAGLQCLDSMVIEGSPALRMRGSHCAHVCLDAIENDKSSEITQDWLTASAVTSIRKEAFHTRIDRRFRTGSSPLKALRQERVGRRRSPRNQTVRLNLNDKEKDHEAAY